MIDAHFNMQSYVGLIAMEKNKSGFIHTNSKFFTSQPNKWKQTLKKVSVTEQSFAKHLNLIQLA